jgi:lipopolysaccharide export system protein LptA
LARRLALKISKGILLHASVSGIQKKEAGMKRTDLVWRARLIAAIVCSFLWPLLDARAEDLSGDKAVAGIAWNAENIHLNPDTNTLILEGNAVLQYGGASIRADKIAIARDKSSVKLSGHVGLPTGGSVLNAEEVELDVKSGKLNATGLSISAQTPPENRVGRIEVRGLTRLKDADALAMLNTKIGQPFDRRAWDEDFHRLYDSGRFQNVRTTEPEIVDGKINLSLDLTEKPIVAKLTIEGNTAINSDELMKAIRVREGGVFDPGEVHKDKVKIEQLYKDKQLNPKVDYSTKVLKKHLQSIAGKDVEVQDEVGLTFRIDEK